MRLLQFTRISEEDIAQIKAEFDELHQTMSQNKACGALAEVYDCSCETIRRIIKGHFKITVPKTDRFGVRARPTEADFNAQQWD